MKTNINKIIAALTLNLSVAGNDGESGRNTLGAIAAPTLDGLAAVQAAAVAAQSALAAISCTGYDYACDDVADVIGAVEDYAEALANDDAEGSGAAVAALSALADALRVIEGDAYALADEVADEAADEWVTAFERGEKEWKSRVTVSIMLGDIVVDSTDRGFTVPADPDFVADEDAAW